VWKWFENDPHKSRKGKWGKWKFNRGYQVVRLMKQVFDDPVVKFAATRVSIKFLGPEISTEFHFSLPPPIPHPLARG
jgi:hypothetical protein